MTTNSRLGAQQGEGSDPGRATAAKGASSASAEQPTPGRGLAPEPHLPECIGDPEHKGWCPVAPGRVQSWADVEVGQVWRSRDKRDDGLTVTVLGFTQDRVEIKRLRRSFVSKRNWHSQYERTDR